MHLFYFLPISDITNDALNEILQTLVLLIIEIRAKYLQDNLESNK